MKTTPKLTGSERRYLDHAHCAQTQGITLAQYCRASGLRVQSLYNAKRELKRKGALGVAAPKSSESGDFIAVRVAQAPLLAQGARCVGCGCQVPGLTYDL